MGDIEIGFIYLIALIFMVLVQAEGKIGYDIHVTVSNNTTSSSWGRSHHSNQLTFDSTSQCKGDGNSSKYVRIEGFAGINLKEATYTKEGRLRDENKLFLQSIVSSIDIDEVVTDNSERYRVSINEEMPSYLQSAQEIMYRGEGIHKWNSYINNEDEIMTDYYAKRFSESSLFSAAYQNASIIADVTPATVKEFVGENYTTQFRAASESDLHSGFRFKPSNNFIDEDYTGTFKINKKISTNHNFIKQDGGDFEDDWMGCCPPSDGDLDYSLQIAGLISGRSALIDANHGMK